MQIKLDLINTSKIKVATKLNLMQFGGNLVNIHA